ncbi:MAG TPA: hypothetical protein VFE96_06785 [Candidatus Bathyarchaeia archaeon]|nr:hypothetical protein [Candidatus Bathyarchaeia archaeon]
MRQYDLRCGGYAQVKQYRNALRAFNMSFGEIRLDLSVLRLSNSSGHNIGRLFGLLLLILVGSALLGPVANASTGITIAHTGFTPNPNVTSTPGFVPLIQVLPLVFVGVLLGYGIDELAAVL